MEIKSKEIKIENKEDLEKFLKDEKIPEEVKTVVRNMYKEEIVKKDYQTEEKFLRALERFEKILDIYFERDPEKLNEQQKRIATKALNQCSQILEKLEKETKELE